jgi:hypothetical protein
MYLLILVSLRPAIMQRQPYGLVCRSSFRRFRVVGRLSVPAKYGSDFVPSSDNSLVTLSSVPAGAGSAGRVFAFFLFWY